MRDRRGWLVSYYALLNRRKGFGNSITVTQRDSNGVRNKSEDLSPTRFEPSSRTFLIGEQPNAWDLLQPRAKVSRHRGAEHRRRYGRLGGTSLLSPG